VAYNNVSELLDAWTLTYGFSIAASSNSDTGIIVHDNLVNPDTPVRMQTAPARAATILTVLKRGMRGTVEPRRRDWAASTLSVTNNYIRDSECGSEQHDCRLDWSQEQ